MTASHAPPTSQIESRRPLARTSAHKLKSPRENAAADVNTPEKSSSWSCCGKAGTLVRVLSVLQLSAL